MIQKKNVITNLSNFLLCIQTFDECALSMSSARNSSLSHQNCKFFSLLLLAEDFLHSFPCNSPSFENDSYRTQSNKLDDTIVHEWKCAVRQQ